MSVYPASPQGTASIADSILGTWTFHTSFEHQFTQQLPQHFNEIHGYSPILLEVLVTAFLDKDMSLVHIQA